ncbi:MAG: cupin domain-containing protein [Acidobacteria bacterium]|nr:cupin domain-containing protein [Acidobacteriota bacterium]
MKYYHWDELESVRMEENFLRKLVAGDRLTIARTETAVGSQMRQRCYPHEIFIMVIDGAWKVQVDGRMVIIRANQILHIPPYMEHDVEALDDTLALEIQATSSSAYYRMMEGERHVEDENYLWGV